MIADEALAVVTAVSGRNVALQRTAMDCNACARGVGCGAGLLRRSSKPLRIRWAAGRPLPAVGDRLIPAQPHAVLHAAALGYGAPLAGFMAGVLAAEWLFPAVDGAAIAGALAGGVAGMFAAKRRLGNRCAQWRRAGRQGTP